MVTKQIEYTPLLQKTIDSEARTIINVGGSGSSKSWTIAQRMVLHFVNEKNKQLIITRKTMPACKRSSYGLIVKLLKDYGYYGRVRHNKTDHTISLGSNVMLFFGLDEPTKTKSIDEGANYIWMEEADEFAYDDYMAFSQQLRKPPGNELNHLYLSFNPIDGNGWIPTKLIGAEGVEVIHSTYKDNPLADEAWVKALEDTLKTDENYYRIYALGEWGRLENLIFPDYILVDELPKEFDAWCYGLDFGFSESHKMALIKVLLLGQKLYWQECILESGMTTSDLIERLGHFDRGDIYADSARPDQIEEIFRAGYNIYPANKSVQTGIDVCKRQPIHITKDSVLLSKQVKGYCRKVDKNGNILEEPTKFNDDGPDAGRYGTLGITERFGFATAAPELRKPMTKRPSFSFG